MARELTGDRAGDTVRATYSFLDGAKFLKLGAKSGLVGVPCKAAGMTH